MRSDLDTPKVYHIRSCLFTLWNEWTERHRKASCLRGGRVHGNDGELVRAPNCPISYARRLDRETRPQVNNLVVHPRLSWYS